MAPKPKPKAAGRTPPPQKEQVSSPNNALFLGAILALVLAAAFLAPGLTDAGDAPFRAIRGFAKSLVSGTAQISSIPAHFRHHQIIRSSLASLAAHPPSFSPDFPPCSQLAKVYIIPAAPRCQ